MEARERIQKDKANDEDLATQLEKAKCIIPIFCWKESTNQLGKTRFEVCKEIQLIKKQKEKRAYFELKEKANAILSTGQPVDKLSNKELSIFFIIEKG